MGAPWSRSEPKIVPKVQFLRHVVASKKKKIKKKTDCKPCPMQVLTSDTVRVVSSRVRVVFLSVLALHLSYAFVVIIFLNLF